MRAYNNVNISNHFFDLMVIFAMFIKLINFSHISILGINQRSNAFNEKVYGLEFYMLSPIVYILHL